MVPSTAVLDAPAEAVTGEVPEKVLHPGRRVAAALRAHDSDRWRRDLIFSKETVWRIRDWLGVNIAPIKTADDGQLRDEARG